MGFKLQFKLLMLLPLLALISLLVDITVSGVQAQSPFEQMAVGALSVGSEIMSNLQEGAKVSKQMSFDTGLLAVNSKTAMGFGDAMRSNSDSSDSSEEVVKHRRRRSANSQRLHQLLHRIRRAPCKMMMTATTQPTDDDVEARKRRARKRAANNSSRSRINKTNSKKKQLAPERQRRQVPQLPDEMQQGPTLGERVKHLWLAFVDNVADAVQQMRHKIKGASTQALDGMQSV